MAIPDFQTVMRPLLEQMADGREHPNQETLEALAQQFGLSADERAELLPSGKQPVFVNRVAWAKSHLKGAGIASGDTSPFVGIKDITMMFSVSDLLGVNPFTARILANAAAAAYGMAQVEGDVSAGAGNKPLIAMTNLGVLTEGANHAVALFREAGYDVVVFHAVGSGGQAMEQLMKEGVVGAVFDYAMGEIAGDVFGGLRAGGPERLTVAGSLGLPQVICPGGAEHLGLFVEANEVPDAYQDHLHVFHSPVIFVPRLNRQEFVRVAEEMCKRLERTTGSAVVMLPLRGVGRYSIPGGPLHDEEGDRAFFDALKAGLPEGIEVVEMDAHAEEPHFVEEAVKRLIAMVEAG